MKPETILEQLRRQPFVPVRLYLSDGKTYDIRHPEMAIVTRREIHIGRTSENERSVATQVDFVSLLHVVRVELLTQPPTVIEQR